MFSVSSFDVFILHQLRNKSFQLIPFSLDSAFPETSLVLAPIVGLRVSNYWFWLHICNSIKPLMLASGFLNPKSILIVLQKTRNKNVNILLCTYPVIPSFVHVCIYFEWFPLWLFLELNSLLCNIVLEVFWPFYSLITRNYVTNFNMNFLEVSLLL